MLTEPFNINEFASNLSSQAENSFPKELPESLKSFIINTIKEFTKIAGKSIETEKDYYSIDETIFICQLIG